MKYHTIPVPMFRSGEKGTSERARSREWNGWIGWIDWMDWIGLDWNGMDWIGWIGMDWMDWIELNELDSTWSTIQDSINSPACFAHSLAAHRRQERGSGETGLNHV